MLKDLIMKNRSKRKYYQSTPISQDTLVELVELARLSASEGNRQPLKYYLSNEPKKNNTIFHNIGIAGDPSEGERPPAYIIILNDTRLCPDEGHLVDHGIAAQSILLGATEKGLGGCILSTRSRKELQRELKISDSYEILLIIAIGKPRENFIIEALAPNTENVRNWWDEQGVCHVPKRALQEIIIR